MKSSILVILVGLLYISGPAQNVNEQNLFVGTFTSTEAEGINLCHFDTVTGKLTFHKVFSGIHNPSFLKISPDRNYLYAVTRPNGASREAENYIQAFQIGPDGELEFINRQSSNGRDPCHVDISPNGKYTAIATYGSGTISIYNINLNGSLNRANNTIQNQGSGLNPARQKEPHAHSVLFSPNGRQLFSADLGTDKLNIFDLKKGKIFPSKRQPFVKLTPGSGPRHFTFHPGFKAIYVINELNSSIELLKNRGGKWEIQQTISTIPDEFSEENYCADIHVSADGKYLYGSNRGHNSIAVYRIKENSNKLEWITSVPTQGEWPRNFTLSENGKFLLVANQKSGNIAVFKIDSESGIPEFTGNEVKIPAPVCLGFQ